MAWLYLLIAGFFEVIWVVGLKYSDNFTRILPSIITILAAIFSVWLLGLSLKSIPIGTAYAVWTAIGTIGTLIFGVIVFHEPISLLKILAILLIVFGIIILKTLT